MSTARRVIQMKALVGVFLVVPLSGPASFPKVGRSRPWDIEGRVIERRSPSGQVLARLRLRPGTSPGEFTFEVEDFKHVARAVGAGKISGRTAEVHLVESRSQTKIGMRALAWGTEGEVRITLSLDRLSFNLVVDEKVRALANELQRFIASGTDDAQLSHLAHQLDSALQIRTGYLPFIEQVKSSAAFDILTTVRSLVAAISPEDVRHNLALALILEASRFLAPSTYSRASIDVTRVEGNGQIVRIGHNGAAFYRGFRKGFHSSNLSLVQGSLIACFNWCMDNWRTCSSTCTQPAPLDAICEAWCFATWVWCIIDCII